MTRNSLLTAILVAVLALGTTLPSQAADKGPKMTKQERVCLRNGNKLYEKKRYAEAEVEYRKALQANPASEKAQFNLATALMRQGSVTSQENDDKNPMKQAEGILTNLAKNAQDKQLRGKASYDLGNIAYGRQQYDQAVEFYKHALRCNPDDDQARDNLRLAQLKKQQQDKNKDKNQQDQNKDQDKDQNKDKNQDQDKDKNQNQDKQDQDKQNQDKQNQNQNQQNQDKQDQQQQQQQQGGMSQQNAEQVLKAMQDRERATQQRINAQQAQQHRHERQRTNKKW
jgi:tetratricopeptide (TPR) repeat protein